MSDDLECPYCGKWSEANTDDGNLCEEDQIYEEQCPHCDKHFVATVSWTPVYLSEKADCLNGGEHEWRERKCYPKPKVPEISCRACGEVKQEMVWEFE